MTFTKVVLGVVGVGLLSVTASGQWGNHQAVEVPRLPDGKPNLAARPPRSVDGKPDLSGIWSRVAASERGRVGSDLQNYMPQGSRVPALPWAEALSQQRVDNFGAGNPSERCLPKSFSNQMLLGSPFQIVQTRGLTLVLFEEFNHFRQILTDGRRHPPDPNPSWFGYSVGQWDGDTMLVDTVGFRDQTWLDGTGHPGTEKLRIQERYRRRDFGHMSLEITFDDPGAYSKPWTARIEFELLADTTLLEYVCENNRWVPPAIGK